MGVPTRFPVEVKEQSVTVKIYRLTAKTNASGYAYVVSWVGPNGRERLNRAEYADAESEARSKAAQLAAGIASGSLLSNSDITELKQARDIVAEHGIPLVSAVAEWSKARSFAGPSLVSVCEEWSQRRAATIQRIKVADAVAKFIAAKDAAKKQGTTTYQSKLTPVASEFGSQYLDSITTRDWTRYLVRLDNPVTHNDIRKRIVTLCRWAQNNDYLSPEAILAITKTERQDEPAPTVGILSPEDFKMLLEHFRAKHPRHLAALVLAGFCGLRSDEIQGKQKDRTLRQRWEDIHLKKVGNEMPYLSVTAAKKGTAANRLVYLRGAALAWLKVCPEPRKGWVGEEKVIEKIRLRARKDKFKLPPNCFRHSFITYLAALTENKAKVASEAGHSVQEMDRHYRVPKPKSLGEAWFAIRPEKRPEKTKQASASSPLAKSRKAEAGVGGASSG
jgi:integrase